MSLAHLETLMAFALIMLGLSLLVTVAVQVINVGMQNRGKLLRWGLERFLAQIVKDKGQAARLATQVLTDPALSPDGKRLVADLNFSELRLVLATLAPDALRDPTSLVDDASASIVEYLETGGPNGAAISPGTAGLKAAIQEKITKFENGVNKRIESLEQTFQLFMDRTTERYIAYSRVIAIVFSILLCVGLQIDSLRILEQLSTDSELRTKLVMGAEATLDRADKTFALTDASKELSTRALERVRAPRPDDPHKEIRTTIPPAPAGMLLESRGKDWIISKVENEPARLAFVAEYKTAFDDLVAGDLRKMHDEAKSLIDKLDESKLLLFKLPDNREAYFAEFGSWRRLLGILITSVLISLGAPFWYKTLRGLTNLRPFIANREEAAREQKEKQ